MTELCDCSSAVSRLELPVIPFRLNEGHTVYLERMIGRCLESEQFRQFKAMGGWKDLQDSVRTWSWSWNLEEPQVSSKNIEECRGSSFLDVLQCSSRFLELC